ncbi:hypothetical protein C7B77_21385 [Chamaesiphon polymorphus CCALA 037]|uniref:Uncharacterized protein n=1 Tax=Chamaesiphon polymorphus CCALA 037 TaxID=2107692 RepID=A0A2T1G321_9CYAN|nr:hypothetical protein C7B77_21385 [Chamaesiphon polymorphus CCALA 037]
MSIRNRSWELGVGSWELGVGSWELRLALVGFPDGLARQDRELGEYRQWLLYLRRSVIVIPNPKNRATARV